MRQPTRRNEPSRAGARPAGRDIGPVGTAARVCIGVALVGSVTYGHLAGEFRPAPWVFGLVGFPALLLGWQWWRSCRAPARLEATGAAAQVLNIAAFGALYLTPEYAPALRATSDASLLFYGSSMLLAALRGYAGCEVLAVSNWLLRRDDQIGCLLFGPLDHLERRRPRGGGGACHPEPTLGKESPRREHHTDLSVDATTR